MKIHDHVKTYKCSQWYSYELKTENVNTKTHKQWYIQTMENYSAIKRKELLIHTIT